MDEFDQKMEISEQPQEEIVEKIPGRDVYETVSSLVSALLVVVLVFTFLVRLMGVSGPSMIPTLQDGDRLLVVNSLLCGDYQVGDIVIARKETFDSKPIVKRVIATAGQTVDIDFNLGQVYVDGELLTRTTSTTTPIAKRAPCSRLPCRRAKSSSWVTTATIRTTAAIPRSARWTRAF